MGIDMGELVEGELYEVRVNAKSPHGEGIGRVQELSDMPVFIRNAHTHIGKVYKVKITKVHRTFAYAEPAEANKYFIGNGGLIIV